MHPSYGKCYGNMKFEHTAINLNTMATPTWDQLMFLMLSQSRWCQQPSMPPFETKRITCAKSPSASCCSPLRTAHGRGRWPGSTLKPTIWQQDSEMTLQVFQARLTKIGCNKSTKVRTKSAQKLASKHRNYKLVMLTEGTSWWPYVLVCHQRVQS